ncbi:hypothetical protein [Sinosporangium siamense]|nr:hypothetical protein [Sinosporangium siamense]
MAPCPAGIADAEEEDDLYDIEAAAGEWAGAGDNGILFNRLPGERCLIKYELWDGQPPPLRSWDGVWSGTVRFASGKIFAVKEHSGNTFYGAEFDLGRMDGLWDVRVHHKSLGHEEFTPALVGFTLLKLQFWPSQG